MADCTKKPKPALTAEDLVVINKILAQDKTVVIMPKRDSVAIAVQTNKIERMVTSGGA